MNQNFWQKLKKPFTILAPMANVTDWAFRQVIIETGTSTGLSVNRPDVFFTEFISADGICVAGKDKFKGELYFEENERPIVVQFFSANPEHMYRCAQLAQELGFDGIDINMGCPDKSVEKQGAGAALMKNPELAKKIIEETIRGAHSTSSGQAGLPVSVKTRLGFNSIDHDWIKHILDTDIVTLSVHARTRKEMSKVPAHWDELGKIVEIASEIHGGPSTRSTKPPVRGPEQGPSGPVEWQGGEPVESTSSGRLSTKPLIIGNGDVANMDDVREKAKMYNLDGIMVGRGIFDNPWFFAGKEVSDPKQRINLLLKHLNNFEKLWLSDGGGKNFDVMKRFFKIYINGYPGAKELRTQLMMTKNKDEVLAILKSFK